MLKHLFLTFFLYLMSISLGHSVGAGNPQGLDSSGEQLGANQPVAVKMDANVVWAVNVGGAEYLAQEGILYQADQLDLQATSGKIEAIKGSQDSQVFRSYRSGPMHLQHPLPNGRYDIVFKFAEPEDLSIGERVFDVLAEGKVVISKLDVRLARDGNHASALVRSVVDVSVIDGMLDIQFDAKAGQPLLNALVVKQKNSIDYSAWQLIWSDEFDYQGQPDSNKWSYNIWPAGKVNNEEQAYTAREKNVRVEDGMLIIEAHKEAYDGADYTSGRLHSAGKGDFQYGRAEIRAKLPAGQGTWPAVWMLPSDPFKYASNCKQGEDWQGSATCDAWPNSGEIDIMEHVGYDMNRVHGTVHTKAYYWVNGEQRKASIEAQKTDQSFHTYAMEWSPERIDVFYDDSLYFSYLNQGEGWQAWPFDHPFHLILNIAVGGGWGSAGGPTDASVFPVRMEVDYVRVYQPAQEAN